VAGKITGGCACGAVRYEAAADPVAMLNCHCRDCQRATGSAYSASVVVPRAAVAMKGELRSHEAVSDSGHAVWRSFCPLCGSPIAIDLARIPDVLALRAGSLDDPSLHTPSVEVFTASAQPWDHMMPGTRKLPRGSEG
jgi:hypothetical protein